MAGRELAWQRALASLPWAWRLVQFLASWEVPGTERKAWEAPPQPCAPTTPRNMPPRSIWEPQCPGRSAVGKVPPGWARPQPWPAGQGVGLASVAWAAPWQQL